MLAGLTAFGFAPILVRFASDTSPLVLVVYRTVFAAAMLFPFWIWLRSSEQRSGKGKERLWIALSGVCLGLHFTFWISSLYYTSVASASVLVTIHPIIMILVERLWFKRGFAKTTWIGVLLAFSGSVLLGISDSQIEQDFADPLFGNFLALTAAIIFVVYLLIGQKIRRKREWIDYVFPVYFYAAAACVLMAVVMGKNLLDISKIGVWAGAGLAFGPQILGHGSMNYAVKFVSPTLLSTLILVEPLLASVLAFFLFAELPPITSIIAMAIIL
ncbi:MAG: EamA family transporter, partial [Aliifodinibius sp.]|nr:EamA family transporter [Fodinibius sp.]NIV14539.1 EamA family transporter [Fodinibius sp.]NIY28383.1 EamA family transporter [Fodinibius sp.]